MDRFALGFASVTNNPKISVAYSSKNLSYLFANRLWLQGSKTAHLETYPRAMADPGETSVSAQVQVESWTLTHMPLARASLVATPDTGSQNTHPCRGRPRMPYRRLHQRCSKSLEVTHSHPQQPQTAAAPPVSLNLLRSHPKVQVTELELANVKTPPSPFPPILMILVEKIEQSTASRKLTFFPSVLSGLWEKVSLQKVNHEIETTGSPTGVCRAAFGHLALFKGTCPFLRPPGQSHWHHHLASMKSRNGFRSVRPASEENCGWL